MNQVRKNILPLSYMLSIPLLSVTYRILNHSGRGVHYLATGLDDKIPFLKMFIIPYISWYDFVFLCLVYFCLNDRRIYFRTLAAINIGLVICYSIYYVYQTTVPRPLLTGEDVFVKLVACLYSLDRPYNCFPSIHVLVSFLMIKAILNSRAKRLMNMTVICSVALLIIASTLFIKQHVLYDVVAAVILGDIIFNYLFYWDCLGITFWKEKVCSLSGRIKKLGI